MILQLMTYLKYLDFFTQKRITTITFMHVMKDSAR